MDKVEPFAPRPAAEPERDPPAGDTGLDLARREWAGLLGLRRLTTVGLALQTAASLALLLVITLLFLAQVAAAASILVLGILLHGPPVVGGVVLWRAEPPTRRGRVVLWVLAALLLALLLLKVAGVAAELEPSNRPESPSLGGALVRFLSLAVTALLVGAIASVAAAVSGRPAARLTRTRLGMRRRWQAVVWCPCLLAVVAPVAWGAVLLRDECPDAGRGAERAAVPPARTVVGEGPAELRELVRGTGLREGGLADVGSRSFVHDGVTYKRDNPPSEASFGEWGSQPDGRARLRIFFLHYPTTPERQGAVTACLEYKAELHDLRRVELEPEELTGLGDDAFQLWPESGPYRLVRVGDVLIEIQVDTLDRPTTVPADEKERVNVRLADIASRAAIARLGPTATP